MNFSFMITIIFIILDFYSFKYEKYTKIWILNICCWFIGNN